MNSVAPVIAAYGFGETQRAPRDVLREVFGFPGFRGLQEAVISRVTGGGDALVLMPTGAGKSLCYQVPALCRPGTAIVVSPLIALMQDQVAALHQLGVAAAALHSELEPGEARDIIRALDDGRLDLLYVSPERLLMSGTLERLSQIDIALIAIDEAHCVSAWGHEFRPEYRGLASLAERFPGVPRIALTATADHRTRDDILAALNMGDAEVFAASFHRDNLIISAAPKIGETAQLQDFLARHPGEAGIVYCGSRAKTERVAAKLVEKGLAAVTYHAGMPPDAKRAALRRFRSGEPVIVVATIAFGMGIDRPDVRFVVHLDMPDGPEAYYQQIGRAGRDGDPSETMLLYGGEDIGRARHFLAISSAPEAQKRVMRDRLEAMIALAETVSCRTRTLLACFGEDLGRACGHCDNCQEAPKTFDGTVAAQKMLSAIYRTSRNGQSFGAMHVIAVLRGEKTDMVIRYHHDELPTFGAGADHSVQFWRGVLRQLIAFGAVRTDEGDYPTLSLVQDQARPILRGELPIQLREDPTRRKPRVSATSATTPASSNPHMFEQLRTWRAATARAERVPPYIIFLDSTLREIASVLPASLDALAEIKGVGRSKLERYGAQVLRLLGK